MSPRYIGTSAQSTLHSKTGRSARKRVPVAAATAVAAAGIGAAAAFFGSTPASAITNSAMAGQAVSGSSAGYSATTTVNAVIALGSHTNATRTKPQLSGLLRRFGILNRRARARAVDRHQRQRPKDPKANVLDVEPGNATPAGAAVWVNARLGADHSATAIVYTMLSDWQQVKAHVGGLPGWMQSHVLY